MAKNFTDKSLEQLKSPTKGQDEHWDRQVPGLGVRVGKTGAKSFNLRTRIMKVGEKKNINMTLGRYPALSLAEARETAREYIKIAAKGKDPRNAKRDAQREVLEASRNTFAACRDKFIEMGEKHGIKKRGKPWKPSTLSNNKWALSYCDELADLTITEITRGAIQDLIDDVEETVAANDQEEQTGAATAHKVHELLYSMLSWCVRRDYLELSPCQGIEVPEKRHRERVLSDSEVKVIWNACVDHGGPLADVFRVLILTGQRRSEISMMRWDEVDLDKDVFSMDGKRTKNGLPHVVPLSPLALSIIKGQKKRGKYVFTTTGKNPVSGFSKIKANIAKLSKTEDWRIHDFRRTMVTGMNEMEIAPHVVEAVVNHVSGEAKRGVAGVYNKAQYLKAREHALNVWSEHVETIVSGKPATGGNVIEMEASA